MSIILDGSTGITLPTGAEVVSTTGTQTLTNKTISGASNTIDNLNASNLASGTVPTARLGTGTADSTTFLRGDGTWQTISTTPTTSEVLTATAGASAGAVGTYAWLRKTTSGGGTTGSTVAGSSLTYAGQLGGPSVETGNGIFIQLSTSSGTPSGTWRCMGVSGLNYETVWLRIS